MQPVSGTGEMDSAPQLHSENMKTYPEPRIFDVGRCAHRDRFAEPQAPHADISGTALSFRRISLKVPSSFPAGCRAAVRRWSS